MREIKFSKRELDILWATFEEHHDIAQGEDKKLHSYKDEFINDTQKELENLANKLYKLTFKQKEEI